MILDSQTKSYTNNSNLYNEYLNRTEYFIPIDNQTEKIINVITTYIFPVENTITALIIIFLTFLLFFLPNKQKNLQTNKDKNCFKTYDRG